MQNYKKIMNNDIDKMPKRKVMVSMFESIYQMSSFIN
jgi:hypothetical protein